MESNQDNIHKEENAIDMFYGATQATFIFAKQLRENPTPEEVLFWGKVRNKLLGVKVRRQHPIGIYIADFYIHELKLVVEIDGGVHKEIDQKSYDIARTAEMERFGIKTVRFTNEQINQSLQSCINTVQKLINNLRNI